MHTTRWRTLLVFVLSVTACSNAANTIPITGTVWDEHNVPIANAAISYGTAAKTTVTDANGAFALAYAGNPNLAVTLVSQATGYASVSRRLTLGANQHATANFAMRLIDSQVTVTLPTDPSAAPATVSAQHGDATTLLTLGAGSLVTPSGATVTGDVNVTMTFWSPSGSVISAPAQLLATDPNGNIAQLVTRGMADIVITQGGSTLQVAPNHTLGWQVTLPAGQRIGLNQLKPQSLRQPIYLFYADMSTGLWVLQDSTPVTVDPNAGILTGALKHLTVWNFDEFFGYASQGGCVQGQVVNECGGPLGNQGFDIYNLSFDNTAIIPMETGSNGAYCINIGTRTQYTEQLFYYMADAADPNNSNICNPLPADAINACWHGQNTIMEPCSPDVLGPIGLYCPANSSTCSHYGDCTYDTNACDTNGQQDAWGCA